jgi:TonB dependent receptor
MPRGREGLPPTAYLAKHGIVGQRALSVRGQAHPVGSGDRRGWAHGGSRHQEPPQPRCAQGQPPPKQGECPGRSGLRSRVGARHVAQQVVEIVLHLRDNRVRGGSHGASPFVSRWVARPDVHPRLHGVQRTFFPNDPSRRAPTNFGHTHINSTESWRYGLAVDQKFPQNLYGGVELSIRDLEVPFQQVISPAIRIRRADWNEYLGRAYLFWTPHDWVALGAEYQYARFTRDEELAPRFKEVTTQRVPLGLRFFHPSRLSAALRATYFHQEGDFQRLLTGVFESGDDNFWVVDAALSYRLPKRYGFLTVAATNLFDQYFRYQETDLSLVAGNQETMPLEPISLTRNALIQPARTFFAILTLAFP